MKNLRSFSVAALIACQSMAAQSADLTVNISDINRLQGHIVVSLFSGADGYEKNEPLSFNRVKVEKERVATTFKDLPEGTYAVKLIHDDNDNGKLDVNILGIPKEGYGFSNNGGAYGPSPYNEAKFDLKENREITINLL